MGLRTSTCASTRVRGWGLERSAQGPRRASLPTTPCRRGWQTDRLELATAGGCQARVQHGTIFVHELLVRPASAPSTGCCCRGRRCRKGCRAPPPCANGLSLLSGSNNFLSASALSLRPLGRFESSCAASSSRGFDWRGRTEQVLVLGLGRVIGRRTVWQPGARSSARTAGSSFFSWPSRPKLQAS